MNKIAILTASSAIALIALVLFQISWYKHSKGLLEEQFNSTVNMAMCLAIQNVSQDSLVPGCSVSPPAVVEMEADNEFTSVLEKEVDLEELDRALGDALAFYNVDLDYEFRILDIAKPASCGTGYCCSLTPFVKSQTQSLQVFFPGKTPYLMGKMKYLLGACLFIILFISAVFLLANYLLLQQKRIAQSNVDFFNNMAHEFNTPLTNISLATKLYTKTNKTASNNKFVSIIKNESAKLKEQVERFLQLMKMENGSLQLHLEPLDLNDLLQRIINEMELQVTEQHGQIKLHLPDTPIYVEADRFHLGNAFRNLIDNSIKYAIDHPFIDVYLKKENEIVSILFEDKGTGISTGDQKHIFKKFCRVHTGDIHQQKGFGLGLAYVKTIIEAHHGAINVFSEVNKGCRFNLQLPLN